MKKIFIIGICLLLGGCTTVKPDNCGCASLPGAFDHRTNPVTWQERNAYLMPQANERTAILNLDQKRDFKSDDIDLDGVVNQLDPSPYDWRETGYQPFGVLAFLSWRHVWNQFKYDEVALTEAVADLEELGVSYVRMDFSWDDIEPTHGTFVFEKYDSIIEKLSAANIRILGIVDYCATWAGAVWNDAPNDDQDFVNFLSVIVERYKNRVKYWEIWNEPDSRSYWQTQDDMKRYTELLGKCYTRAKEIDPSCKILMGGVTTAGYYAIKNIYRNGGKDSFDILNIHPFVNPEHPDTYVRINIIYDKLRELQEEYHDTDKPIWFTELGCPGLPPGAEERGWWEGVAPTEEEQATFLDYVFTDVVALPKVDRVFWAFFRDNKDHFYTDVDYFGLLRWDFTKKAAFEHYKKIIHEWQNDK